MNHEVITLVSSSPNHTVNIGRLLGRILGKGDIIALVGDLGAGKTCLAQGIARGLDVPEYYEITSPTFTLINEYPGRLKLCHVDLYRLDGIEDLTDTGYEDMLDDDGVIIIEWAEKILNTLPPETSFIIITHLDEQTRKIELSINPAYRSELLEALREKESEKHGTCCPEVRWYVRR